MGYRLHLKSKAVGRNQKVTCDLILLEVPKPKQTPRPQEIQDRLSRDNSASPSRSHRTADAAARGLAPLGQKQSHGTLGPKGSGPDEGSFFSNVRIGGKREERRKGNWRGPGAPVSLIAAVSFVNWTRGAPNSRLRSAPESTSQF